MRRLEGLILGSVLVAVVALILWPIVALFLALFRGISATFR